MAKRVKKLNREQQIMGTVELLKKFNGKAFDREFTVSWVNHLMGVHGFKRNKSAEIDTIAVLETIESKTHHVIHIGKDATSRLLFAHGTKLATDESIAFVNGLPDLYVPKAIREQRQAEKVVSSGSVPAEKIEPIVEKSTASERFKIKVKQWMTRKDDNPLPMRTMAGEVLRETAKAVQVRLTGLLEPSSECLHCGRELKHPVSLLYGIGPICGQHFHINPLNSEEELQKAYAGMCAKMEGVTWEGWLPKSQIVNMTPLI